MNSGWGVNASLCTSLGEGPATTRTPIAASRDLRPTLAPDRRIAVTTVDPTLERCKSCDAPVIWCATEKLKPMPVNFEPEAGGNLALDARSDGRMPFARVVDKKHAWGRTDLHKSHFATCPEAASWRKKRGGA